MKDWSRFFAALADESRLRLLHLMGGGEVCVCHLQDVLQTNQPKISRHLAYLKRAGLVSARREGKWMYYRLAKLDGPRRRLLGEALRLSKGKAEIQKDNRRFRRIGERSKEARPSRLTLSKRCC